MKKIILLPFVLILMLVVLISAFDVDLTKFDEFKISPLDGVLNIHKDGNYSILCNFTPQYNYSVANITLYINNVTNASVNYTDRVAGASREQTFLINGSVDGTSHNWSCEAYLNTTTTFVNNRTDERTIFFERPPDINVISPTTGSSDSTTDRRVDIRINITGPSIGGSGGDERYFCFVYENSTRNYTRNPTGFILFNNSNLSDGNIGIQNITYQFGTDGTINWNLECEENNNRAVKGTIVLNQTIVVDTTDPEITASAETYSKFTIATDTFSVFVNFTVVDNNPDSCVLFINGTSNRTESYTSNVASAIYFNASDGAYNWMLTCNDTLGQSASTVNTSINIDTSVPTWSSSENYSITSCDSFQFDEISSETVNMTFAWGLTDNSRTHSLVESDFATNQSFNLKFNATYETNYFINYSFCDIAGNCAASHTQQASPILICTGWSIWSVYDNAINFSDYFSASKVDFIYLWNSTGQTWRYYSSSSTGLGSDNLVIGDAIYLYTATNQSYFRNNTGNPAYLKNITVGDNYFALYNEYSFGNLTYNIFRNDSQGDVTPVTTIYGDGNLQFNFTHFYSYNNSAHSWVPYTHLYDINNDTVLGKAYKNGLDTLWLFSEYNVTINMTPNGEVIANWTR